MSPLSRQFQSLGRKPMPISCSFGRSAAQVITNGSINDRDLRHEHRGHVYAACASLAACKPRRMDGPAARRARVNVAPADAEDAEAGLRLRAANFRRGVEW